MNVNCTLDIIEKPKVKVDSSILESVKRLEDEERQVVLHCEIPLPIHFGLMIRIFSSSYLYDAHSVCKAELLHHENIALGPAWKHIPPGAPIRFSLFFKGLPKSCTMFHFKEEIADNSGFEFRNIVRNDSDVYSVKLSPF